MRQAEDGATGTVRGQGAERGQQRGQRPVEERRRLRDPEQKVVLEGAASYLGHVLPRGCKG